ncbi:hypothetical protein UUU_13140 [Klebsiella pneumoniae subsp. pneumoniae DSM 30104 = JCM 1662 = NBRC 14940]|nr:hypothetical protein UUU_13140 [Klebsiella pneumoniae subsp. pneumoniae DSM 30104 = JCM 1662 = NBRC 14940]
MPGKSPIHWQLLLHTSLTKSLCSFFTTTNSLQSQPNVCQLLWGSHGHSQTQ